MDQTTPIGGSLTGRAAYPNATPAGPKVEDAVRAAHQTTSKIADKATAQIDRLSGTAHRAVNSAADVASSAAEWASAIPEQAERVQAQLMDAATASIRARPIAMVAGALVVGYLLGRSGRL